MCLDPSWSLEVTLTRFKTKDGDMARFGLKWFLRLSSAARASDVSGEKRVSSAFKSGTITSLTTKGGPCGSLVFPPSGALHRMIMENSQFSSKGTSLLLSGFAFFLLATKHF